MRTKMLLSLAGLAFWTVSCGGTMDHDGARMSEALDEARLEVDRHHTAVVGLENITDLPSELRRHRSKMLGTMARMQGSMHSMTHCSSGSMDRMHQMMGDMQARMDEHAAGVGDASTLEDVRLACAAHTKAMHGSLNGMHDIAGKSCMGGH